MMRESALLVLLTAVVAASVAIPAYNMGRKDQNVTKKGMETKPNEEDILKKVARRNVDDVYETMLRGGLKYDEAVAMIAGLLENEDLEACSRYIMGRAENIAHMSQIDLARVQKSHEKYLAEREKACPARVVP